MSLWRLVHIGPFIALFVTFVCYCVAVIDSYLWLFPLHTSKFGIWNLIILTIWLALILRNFFFAVLLGPGFVPLEWTPDDKDDEKYLQYCFICKGYKPPRAHHCRACKRCVMKMDHHCPWINTCCGHQNHTNFVLFLFFAPVGCIHALIVCIFTLLYQLLWRAEMYQYAVAPVHFGVNAFFLNIIACGLAFGTIVAVGVLFAQQLKIIITNKTGIEQWIIDKAEERTGQGAPPFTYPYDLGYKKNLSQIINWNCRPEGSGYSWPVVEGCTNLTLSIEQLEQKREKRKRTVLFLVKESYSGWWCPCTKGLCTCIRIPISDEPRIRLEVGDKIEVTRGSHYWLYGNKVLSETESNEGKRVRGWFPRRCVLRLSPPRAMPNDTDENTKKKD
uniref:palmitoyltransferase ZDHHC6-like n=1 Tax=Styela clava TaxID=7725 RepID=UPI00193967FC|nr:palmitoyltransferase ZDHHC6-like [Styela clava]